MYIYYFEGTTFNSTFICDRCLFENQYKFFYVIHTMVKILILLSVIFLSVYLTEQAYFLKHDYIRQINNIATTWKVSSITIAFNNNL